MWLLVGAAQPCSKEVPSIVNTLCFGDSNTFGTNPKGRRHSWSTRWPGWPQILLEPEYHVIEEGMDGHITVWNSLLEPGWCGIQAPPMVFQSHKPLDLVILFLGINDCKTYSHISPRAVTKGIENPCHVVRGSDYGEDYKRPKILVISPIHIGSDMEYCSYVNFDETAPGKSMVPVPPYQELAETEGCLSPGVTPLTDPGSTDQLHIDTKDHGALAEGITEVVKGYFEP